ncbi:MAG: radical SAM protein [Acetatifactor sp.]|nr:radical SAM protein [Acetatifactor sp.]
MNNSVRWEITSGCNLDCRHCAVHEVKKADLPFEEAKRIVDRVVRMGVNEILFSTKEPFVYKYFWELLEYCSNMGIYAKILTNGTLLDEAMVKRLYRYRIKMICISLDGWTEEDNDMIRGKGTFRKIMEVIGLFHKYNIDLEYPYIQIFVQNCITGDNIAHVGCIGDLFEEYPEVNISLSPVMLLGNAKINQDIRAERGRMLRYKDELYGMIRKIRPEMFIREKSYFGGIANNFRYGLNEIPVIPSCGARDPGITSILSDGKLCKCIMLLDSGVEYPGQILYGNAAENIGQVRTATVDDSFYKKNPTCQRCPISGECELCLATSLSPEALHEQLENCGAEMDEVDDIIRGIRDGLIRIHINDSIILYNMCAFTVMRTKETGKYSPTPELYGFLSEYLTEDSVPPEASQQLADEDIRYLLTNNLIWEAG